MELRFYVEGPGDSPDVHVEELLRRVQRRFPEIVIDRQKGNEWVQRKLDELISMGAPDVILESHKTQFGGLIFVSVSDRRWGGASATSYLRSISPPLGDRIHFEVNGTDDEAVIRLIEQDLMASLEMNLC